MKLLPHQQNFIDKNPKKALLNWEMRVGKSLPAAVWIDMPCRSGNTYIICKKKNKKSWLEFKTKATVLIKEEFRKVAPSIKNPTAIVIDEIHWFASPLFLKGRSALAESLYNITKQNPDCNILGLSATMIRQNPWSLHTILCYAGIYYDWKEWRNRFFELKRMPFLRFPAWFPKHDWRVGVSAIRDKHCSIIALHEVVDNLPPAETRIIKIKQEKYEKPIDEIVTWTHEHRHEQQNKVSEILELDYKKLIVVANYTSQIDELAKELVKEKPVFIVDGRTKDAEKTIEEAQNADECYLIVQSGCGEGWDGWMFGAMVFVSMSHSCTNHTQMLGRQRHPKHLRITETYYLIGGRWDQRIYNTIQAGEDFNPFKYESY